MNVQVEILVSRQPTAQDLNRIKAVAAALTDDRDSIAVMAQKGDHHYEVTVDFTMMKAAQSQVVEGIARAFKAGLGNLQDYQDISISFPKGSRGRQSQG
jgi:hypothetical protein